MKTLRNWLRSLLIRFAKEGDIPEYNIIRARQTGKNIQLADYAIFALMKDGAVQIWDNPLLVKLIIRRLEAEHQGRLFHVNKTLNTTTIKFYEKQK